MLYLAQSPQKRETFCSNYNKNGFRFYTMQHDKTRKTENYGVVVRSDDQSVLVPYYRVLKETVEFYNNKANKVVLFNYDWF